MKRIKHILVLVTVLVFALSACVPTGSLAAASPVSGRLTASANAPDLAGSSNMVAPGQNAVLWLPAITGLPAEAGGSVQLPTVSWSANGQRETDISVWEDAYIPEDGGLWPQRSIIIPADALREGSNTVVVTLSAGDGNEWTNVQNGTLESGSTAVFQYDLAVAVPIVGRLTASADALDLAGNTVAPGENCDLQLPALTGTPAETAGLEQLPTVSWSVNGHEEADIHAWEDGWTPDENGEWPKKFISIPARALTRGENTVLVTLHAGAGNIWTQVHGGTPASASEVVFRYQVSVQEPQTGELTAMVSLSTMSDSHNTCREGAAAELTLPKISGTPAQADGAYVMPTVTWIVNGESGTDRSYSGKYDPEGRGEWGTATVTIPPEVLKVGKNAVRIVIHAGAGNSWRRVDNGMINDEGQAAFLYGVRVTAAANEDAGRLTASISPSDLSATRFPVHTEQDAVLFLPELIGLLARDPDGEYRPPQVAFSVDGSELQWASPSPYENGFLAGSDEWLPATLAVPGDALTAGANTIRVELLSGEANVWTAAENGSVENDGTRAVFIYHVEVSDAPYLAWEESAATWVRLGVGEETTLTASVRPSGSGAAARSCRWTLYVDGLEGQEDAAAEYVAWTAGGDGSETPSITLTGLKEAGPVPVNVTLTAEVAGQELSIETAVFISDSVVPIQPGPGSPIRISGTGANRYATGLDATSAGLRAYVVQRLLAWQPLEDCSLQISGSGQILGTYDVVGTGLMLTLTGGSEVLDSAAFVLTGDAIGSGRMNIAQLVRVAQCLNGTVQLTGPYLAAVDFNHNGRADVSDLVAEAALL